MGVHESQSLLWERCVGLSKPFSRYLVPKLAQHFPEGTRGLTPVRAVKSLPKKAR